MSRGALAPGASASATWEVTEADLASALGREVGDDFPPVLATSRMIALMEVASARAMQPLLAEGELSVGVSVEVTHSAATLPGGTVRATARFERMEGRLYVFSVVAEDAGGEVGRGLHRRAIVATERLLAGARRRQGGS